MEPQTLNMLSSLTDNWVREVFECHCLANGAGLFIEPDCQKDDDLYLENEASQRACNNHGDDTHSVRSIDIPNEY